MFLFLGLLFFFLAGAKTLLSEHQTKNITINDTSGNITGIDGMSHMPPYMESVYDSLFEHETSNSKRSLTGADVVANYISPLGTIVSVAKANVNILIQGLDTYYYYGWDIHILQVLVLVVSMDSSIILQGYFNTCIWKLIKVMSL